MKTIIKFFALFIAVGIVSCGSDDDNGSGVATATSIELSANVTTVYVNGSVTFSVEDNLGNNVTSESDFTNNGNLMLATTYTFSEVGTYNIEATYQGLTSSVSIEVTLPNSIILSSNKTSCWVTDSALFTITDDLGTNITAVAAISVEGTAIASNAHTFDAAGSYNVVATYLGLTSNTVTVQAVNSTHTTKVMVEDYTGTWCGYCPRLAYKIDQLAMNNANVIPVAVHDDTPFGFESVSTLSSAFGITGFPTGKINRTLTWNESDSQVLSQLNDFKACGLALETSMSGSSLSVSVDVHYDIDADSDHKLVVYILEDDLLYDQVNYMNGDPSSPWYGMGDPIVNFEHDNVARTTLTAVLGDAIPASEAVLGNTYSADFTYSIPSAYDTNNLEVVAFVVDASKTVVNVQMVKAGDDQPFD